MVWWKENNCAAKVRLIYFETEKLSSIFSTLYKYTRKDVLVEPLMGPLQLMKYSSFGKKSTLSKSAIEL